MSSLWLRGLTVSLLVLGTACATHLREGALNALVSEQEERAQTAEFERRAARFRWNQQVRLEQVLMRLLLAMPNPPRVGVEVAGCDAVNAYVVRERIHVCLGMLRFVQSDDELAVVVGHELGHLPTSARHGLIGGVRGDEEREADVLGLLYAHRAGYDIKVGARVFERMAVELSPGLEEPGSHPSHAERMLLAEKITLHLDRGGEAMDLVLLPKRPHGLIPSLDDLP